MILNDFMLAVLHMSTTPNPCTVYLNQNFEARYADSDQW